MEGKEDVQSGDVREGETSLYGKGDGDTGSGAGVWAAPGHGKEDAPVFSAAGGTGDNVRLAGLN